MRPMIENALIVALWLENESKKDCYRLQPTHLHLLLYQAQVIYTLEAPGSMLMPAQFAAFKDGPREPTLYAIMSELPYLGDAPPLTDEPQAFLDRFWSKFGHKQAKTLLKEIHNHPPFSKSLKRGEGSIIPLDTIIDYSKQYKQRKDFIKVADGRHLMRWTPQRHKAAQR